MIGVAVDDVEQLVAEHGQLGRRRPARLGHPVGADHHLVHHPVVDGGEQLLLRPDVVVEGALAEPVDLAQLRRCRWRGSRCWAKTVRRGVDDGVAPGLPLLAAAGLVARSGARHLARRYTARPDPATRHPSSRSRGERAPLRRAGRGRHRRRARHRPGLRPAARRPGRQRRRQRPRRLDRRRRGRRRAGGRRGRRDRRRRRRGGRRRQRRRRRPRARQALVDAAVERFGRIDVVVNNAGIVRWAGFPEADADNLERHLAVHVGGSFNTTRAAWPHMVEQGYGRIVMTTSTGHVRPPQQHRPTPRPRPASSG